MDPNVTLQRIFWMLERGNYDEAWRSCFDLKQWIYNGGFVPGLGDQEYTKDEMFAFLRIVMAQCKYESGKS